MRLPSRSALALLALLLALGLVAWWGAFWLGFNLDLPPEFAPTSEGYKHFVASMRFAFPECEFKVDQVIAEGDNVCVMYTASAYPEGKAPDERFSGKRETMSSVNLIRFDPETGQVIEHRASGNLTRASNRD